MGLSTEMRTLARYRILREDPETQEMTYMVATLPYKTEASPETHPVVQEFYVLAGEIAGNVGVMQTGAYVWRPEDIPHGPYCNKTGALFLMRTLGGPLTTVHLDPVPYSFDTPYRPVLPPELAPLGAKPRPRTPRY
jgi:hypothetical protein